MGWILVILVGVFAQARGQTATPAPTPAAHPEVKRWFEIEGWTLSTRYRYTRDRAGAAANQQQWQTQIRGRLKFDKKGRFSVVGFAGTGNAFNGGWNNTGIGTGPGQSNLFVKQLYIAAKPTKRVEIQFGGIDINRGENTEITTWDNDGYITGERVIVRAPKQIWFDEVSATNGFLGDLNRPSVFGRLRRLKNSNYHQLLVRKQAAKSVAFSADYTFWTGTDFLHEAVKVRPKGLFLTTVLFETYQRVSSPNGFGSDLFAERILNNKMTVNGGFARVDRRMTLNGDRFPPGKRVYGALIYRPNNEFTLQPVLTQGVGPLATPQTPRTRFELILTWNILESLHRHHLL